MSNPSDSEPVEYIYTDAHMTEGLRKALIEKYGHIPDLANMVPVDEDEDYAAPSKYIPAPEDDSGW